MDQPVSDSQLELHRHVEQKIHINTKLLIQKLMTLPAVAHVEVTGHLSVVINKQRTFVVILPPDFNSECISTVACQCTCTPLKDKCIKCEGVCQAVSSPAEDKGVKSEENKTEFRKEDVKGFQAPLENTYDVTETYSTVTVLCDNQSKKISTEQNHALTYAKSTDDLDTSNRAWAYHETLTNDSQPVVIEVSDSQDSLNILNDTENAGSNLHDNLDQPFRAIACQICKLSSCSRNQLAQPERKRGCPKQPAVSSEDEDFIKRSVQRGKKGKKCQQQILTGQALVQNGMLTKHHKQQTLDGSVSSVVVLERMQKTCEETPRKAAELRCSVCDKIYPAGKRMAFRKHLRTHTQNVQCDVCQKWLSNADSLKNHQRGLHSKEKPYSCKECGERFSFYHSFKLHGYKHSGTRPHVCPHCSKAYLTSSHLNAHLISMHTKEKDRQRQFQCEICGHSFASAASLKTHSFRHSDVKPYHCEVCSKGFGTKSALKLHSKSVHVTDRRFECDICHKLYKSEHDLNMHQQRHTAEQNGQFVCDVCGKQFMVLSRLKMHALIHEPTCPYVCKICGKGFKLLSSLYSHHYTHTTERPFQCSKCPKVFKTKSACAAHERRHTATKAFACQRCSARFLDKGGLDKHIRTIHAVTSMLHCMLCGKVGTRMDNMRTHVKSHGRDRTFEQLNACIKQVNSYS